MQTSRIAALIGVASAVAAFSMPIRHSAAPRRLAWPDIDAISLGRDTVWFCAQPQWDQPLNIAYSYVRTTHEWRLITAPRACPARPMRMMSAWDVNSHAVTAAPGVRVEILPQPLIRVTDAPHARRTTLAANGSLRGDDERRHTRNQ